MTSHLRIFLIISILCAVFVAVVVSERKTTSNDGSSSTEIDNHNVERFKRNSVKKDDQKSHNTNHHKKHHKHHKHHKAKNGTSTDGEKKNSIYDSKKVDVNKKAEVVGGEMKAPKPAKRAKVKKSKGGTSTVSHVAIVICFALSNGCF